MHRFAELLYSTWLPYKRASRTEDNFQQREKFSRFLLDKLSVSPSYDFSDSLPAWIIIVQRLFDSPRQVKLLLKVIIAYSLKISAIYAHSLIARQIHYRVHRQFSSKLKLVNSIPTWMFLQFCWIRFSGRFVRTLLTVRANLSLNQTAREICAFSFRKQLW